MMFELSHLTKLAFSPNYKSIEINMLEKNKTRMVGREVLLLPILFNDLGFLTLIFCPLISLKFFRVVFSPFWGR